MTRIRLDKVITSSFHEAYQNYQTARADIVVANTSLANGATREISVNIPYFRQGTRADIYATRGSIKSWISNSGRAAAQAVYQKASTEIARFDTIYGPNSITVKLTIINNTGGSITPNAQTIGISVVQYVAPISPI